MGYTRKRLCRNVVKNRNRNFSSLQNSESPRTEPAPKKFELPAPLCCGMLRGGASATEPAAVPKEGETAALLLARGDEPVKTNSGTSAGGAWKQVGNGQSK